MQTHTHAMIHAQTQIAMCILAALARSYGYEYLYAMLTVGNKWLCSKPTARAAGAAQSPSSSNGNVGLQECLWFFCIFVANIFRELLQPFQYKCHCRHCLYMHRLGIHITYILYEFRMNAWPASHPGKRQATICVDDKCFGAVNSWWLWNE